MKHLITHTEKVEYWKRFYTEMFIQYFLDYNAKLHELQTCDFTGEEEIRNYKIEALIQLIKELK